MFIPTLLSQADAEQQAQFLPDALSLRIVGTYAQTELGHGTFVRGLETTATFDARRDQFVLHSPTLSATKWWPGGLGATATHAVVMARLFCGRGVDRGPHAFVVQLRDMETHEALPGVKCGDIGPKLGFGSVDNGWLELDHVCIREFFFDVFLMFFFYVFFLRSKESEKEERNNSPHSSSSNFRLFDTNPENKQKPPPSSPKHADEVRLRLPRRHLFPSSPLKRKSVLRDTGLCPRDHRRGGGVGPRPLRHHSDSLRRRAEADGSEGGREGVAGAGLPEHGARPAAPGGGEE